MYFLRTFSCMAMMPVFTSRIKRCSGVVSLSSTMQSNLLFILTILPYPFGDSSSIVPTTASAVLSLAISFFIDALVINGTSPHKISILELNGCFFFSADLTAPAVPSKTD